MFPIGLVLIVWSIRAEVFLILKDTFDVEGKVVVAI